MLDTTTLTFNTIRECFTDCKIFLCLDVFKQIFDFYYIKPVVYLSYDDNDIIKIDIDMTATIRDLLGIANQKDIEKWCGREIVNLRYKGRVLDRFKSIFSQVHTPIIVLDIVRKRKFFLLQNMEIPNVCLIVDKDREPTPVVLVINQRGAYFRAVKVRTEYDDYEDSPDWYPENPILTFDTKDLYTRIPMKGDYVSTDRRWKLVSELTFTKDVASATIDRILELFPEVNISMLR